MAATAPQNAPRFVRRSIVAFENILNALAEVDPDRRVSLAEAKRRSEEALSDAYTDEERAVAEAVIALVERLQG